MNADQSMAETIALGRYDLKALAVRLGKNVGGQVVPLPYRTLMRRCKEIDHIGKGRGAIFTEAAVRKWEEQNTRKAA